MTRARLNDLERIGLGLTLLALVLIALTGCEGILDILRPSTTRVELRNDGEFFVDLKLFYSDQQDAPRDLLTSLGHDLEFSVAPGDTVSFERDCDDLQSIVIDDADLRVIGGVGPETDSNVLRDGEDFSCGDVIEFTFDHSELVVDFNVQTSVREDESIAGSVN